MPRHKVQCWIFSTSPTGEKLCLLLKTNVQRGQFWQPVTGSVEKGESFEEGAARELKEETGFDFDPPVYTKYEFEFDARFGKTIERVFAIQLPEPLSPKLDPREHDAFEWVLAKDAPSRLKFETNKIGLSRALAVFP